MHLTQAPLSKGGCHIADYRQYDWGIHYNRNPSTAYAVPLPLDKGGFGWCDKQEFTPHGPPSLGVRDPASMTETVGEGLNPPFVRYGIGTKGGSRPSPTVASATNYHVIAKPVRTLVIAIRNPLKTQISLTFQ